MGAVEGERSEYRDRIMFEYFDEVVITPFDYCDRCYSRAYSVFIRNYLPLYFCGHHTFKYWHQLLEQGFVCAADIRNLQES